VMRRFADEGCRTLSLGIKDDVEDLSQMFRKHSEGE